MIKPTNSIRTQGDQLSTLWFKLTFRTVTFLYTEALILHLYLSCFTSFSFHLVHSSIFLGQMPMIGPGDMAHSNRHYFPQFLVFHHTVSVPGSLFHILLQDEAVNETSVPVANIFDKYIQKQWSIVYLNAGNQNKEMNISLGIGIFLVFFSFMMFKTLSWHSLLQIQEFW